MIKPPHEQEYQWMGVRCSRGLEVEKSHGRKDDHGHKGGDGNRYGFGQPPERHPDRHAQYVPGFRRYTVRRGEMMTPRPRMVPASTVIGRKDFFGASVVWIMGDNYPNMVT